MVAVIANTFTTFTFSSDEILAASSFTELQLQRLYSARAETAEQYINMEPTDYASREEYFIAQTEIRAVIKTYSAIIQAHFEATSRLEAKRQPQQENEGL